jgi:hypothetical protein
MLFYAEQTHIKRLDHLLMLWLQFSSSCTITYICMLGTINMIQQLISLFTIATLFSSCKNQTANWQQLLKITTDKPTKLSLKI